MEDPDVEDKAELLRDKCCRNLVKNKRLVATFDTFGSKKYCNCFYDKVGHWKGALKTHVWSHTINCYLRRSPRRIGTSCFFSGTYDSNIGKSLSTPGPSTAPTHSRDRRSAPRAAKTIFQSENKIFNFCYNLHAYKISRMYNFMRRKRDLQNII